MNEQIEKQAIEEMAEMLEIIENARETYANDVTDHTENEYIREGLLNANYRKQSVGEWVKRIFIIFDSEKVGFTCSECNTTWDTETNFCPNCGSKMKGEGDEG